MGILSLQGQLSERDQELTRERKLRKKLQHQVEAQTEKRLVSELQLSSSPSNNNHHPAVRANGGGGGGVILHQPLIVNNPRPTRMLVGKPKIGAYF